MSLSLNAKFQRTPFCCGLMEIGDFGGTRVEYGFGFGEYKRVKHTLTKKQVRDTKYAFICTTRRKDVTQRAKLKAWGFKRVGTWRNPNTKRSLTLWAYFPK